jgi:hypothetical protein
MLDSLVVKLMKVWWRSEAFLERWRRVVMEHEDDPYLPPDVPRTKQAPYQVVIYGDAGKPSTKRDRFWNAAAGLAIGVLIGFIVGSTWGKSRVTTVEAAQGKLEERVRSLESRTTE